MVNRRPTLYTVPQVAAALGVPAVQVRCLQPDCTADGFALDRGGTPAWSLEAMDGVVRQWLRRTAAEHGYADAAALLACPPDRWLSAEQIVRLDVLRFNVAIAVRSLLLPALTCYEESTDLGEETVRAVAAKTFRDFPERAGSMSRRDLRTLARRAIRRDNEAGQWTRLDPYLPGGSRCGADLAALELVAANARTRRRSSVYFEVWKVLCRKPHLSPSDRDAVWLASFEDQAGKATNGCPDAAAVWLMAADFGGGHLVPGRVSKKGFRRLWQAHYEHWKVTRGGLLTYNALRLLAQQPARRAA